jgi:RNA polymerase sigma factor (sigma-70 family)
MKERDLLAKRFEEHRPRLRALAYRMLGSPSEADDAVQEAWLRLDRSDSGGVENLGGWLTTVVGRVCLNMLRSRLERRERYLEEPWGESSDARMPDPIVDREDGIDPEHQALLADGIGLALLVVLETLRNALSRRADRVRFARHLRCALRGDRTHRGALPGRL